MSRFKWLEFEPPPKSPPPEPLGGGGAGEDGATHGFDLSNPAVVLHLADEAYRQLDYEKALKLYSKTLGLDPNLEEAWVGQLRCLLDLEENPEALTWSVKACKLFPKNPEAISARALALARQGNMPDALAFSDSAMKSVKVGWFAWVARGEILARSGSNNAEFCMVKAREQAPNDWLVVLKVAQAYRRTPSLEKAIPLYRKVLAAQAELAEAWFELGTVQLEMGLVADGRSSLERACKLVPYRRKYADTFSRSLSIGYLEQTATWIQSFLKGIFKR